MFELILSVIATISTALLTLIFSNLAARLDLLPGSWSRTDVSFL